MARPHILFALVVFAWSLQVFSAALPYESSKLVSQCRNTSPAAQETCKDPLKRKEWRTLNDEDKKSYIDAVLCLQQLQSKANDTEIPGARTRWDDFNAAHIIKSRGGGVHEVGHFLPWHRYLLIMFEKALREECGYNGAQPYWNWTLDSKNGTDFFDSPVFDETTGFGGDGESGDKSKHCVQTGPFSNRTFFLNVGPDDQLKYNPHCLSRNFRKEWVGSLESREIERLAEATTFKRFDFIIEGTRSSSNDTVPQNVHSSGHNVVGGDHAHFFSANAEPLFYLHHAFLDCLWLEWQLADHTGSRFREISGPQRAYTSEPQVDLDFQINLALIAPNNITLRRVMDVTKDNTGGIGCYTYDF